MTDELKLCTGHLGGISRVQGFLIYKANPVSVLVSISRFSVPFQIQSLACSVMNHTSSEPICVSKTVLDVHGR